MADFGYSRDSKLDHFLVNKLSPDEFERLRAYESAIMDEKGTLRYVVLSDRALYTIDVPPRAIKLKLPFEKIVSINYEKAVPKFLGGIDKANCQHVKIGFAETSLVNNSKLRKNLSMKDFIKKRPGKKNADLNETLPTEVTVNESLAQNILKFPSEGAIKQEEKVIEYLHVYVRSKTSFFYANFLSAWNSFILRESLKSNQIQESDQHSMYRPDRIQSLFYQLIDDIKESSNDVFEFYHYLTELRVAAKRNFVVKRLFWRSGDFPHFLVSQMSRFIVSSTVDLRHPMSSESRSDELELGCLLLATFSEMLSETEMIPDRVKLLQADEFTLARKLIRICACMPAMPASFKLPVKFRDVPLPCVWSQTHQSDPEESVTASSELLQQFYLLQSASHSLLFELITVSLQANWAAPNSKFTVNWMICNLETLSNDIQPFISRLIFQLMAVVDIRLNKPLTSVETVWVFRCFGLVNSLVEYSEKLAKFVRDEFSEEFRYFLKPDVLGTRLDFTNALSTNLITQMSNAQKLVFKKS